MNLGQGFEEAIGKMEQGNRGGMSGWINDFEKRISSSNLTPPVFGNDQVRLEVMQAALVKFAETEGGAIFLDGLATILQQWAYPALLMGVPRDAKADFAAYREGQNALVFEILSQVKIGRGETITKREVL